MFKEPIDKGAKQHQQNHNDKTAADELDQVNVPDRSASAAISASMCAVGS